jgi:hypothetical protein
LHKCNKEDWAKIYKPAIGDFKVIQNLKNNNAMFCLDKLDSKGKPIRKKEIFGKFG